MNGQVYGYIRVSSREQNEERQLISLREVQVPEENTFIVSSPARILSGRSTRGFCGN